MLVPSLYDEAKLNGTEKNEGVQVVPRCENSAADGYAATLGERDGGRRRVSREILAYLKPPPAVMSRERRQTL